jgi:hypothetical protein
MAQAQTWKKELWRKYKTNNSFTVYNFLIIDGHTETPLVMDTLFASHAPFFLNSYRTVCVCVCVCCLVLSSNKLASSLQDHTKGLVNTVVALIFAGEEGMGDGRFCAGTRISTPPYSVVSPDLSLHIIQVS